MSDEGNRAEIAHFNKLAAGRRRHSSVVGSGLYYS